MGRGRHVHSPRGLGTGSTHANSHPSVRRPLSGVRSPHIPYLWVPRSTLRSLGQRWFGTRSRIRTSAFIRSMMWIRRTSTTTYGKHPEQSPCPAEHNAQPCDGECGGSDVYVNVVGVEYTLEAFDKCDIKGSANGNSCGIYHRGGLELSINFRCLCQQE